MVVPVLLSILCLAGLVAAALHPFGQGWDVVALSALLASLWLLVRAWRNRIHWVVVDGSNVLHWRDNRPDPAPLRAVLATLRRKGWRPVVIFDANAGFKIAGRHMGDVALARLIDLPPRQVALVPSGQPADPTILRTARDLKAPIVTNDRYRDWMSEFPEVRRPGTLIPGRYADGVVTLDLRRPRGGGKRQGKG